MIRPIADIEAIFVISDYCSTHADGRTKNSGAN